MCHLLSVGDITLGSLGTLSNDLLVQKSDQLLLLHDDVLDQNRVELR